MSTFSYTLANGQQITVTATETPPSAMLEQLRKGNDVYFSRQEGGSCMLSEYVAACEARDKAQPQNQVSRDKPWAQVIREGMLANRSKAEQRRASRKAQIQGKILRLKAEIEALEIELLTL